MKKNMDRLAGFLAALFPTSTTQRNRRRSIGGPLRRALVRLWLALAIAGVAATGAGCIWIHGHDHDHDHDHWDHDHDDHDDHHDDDMPH